MQTNKPVHLLAMMAMTAASVLAVNPALAKEADDKEAKTPEDLIKISEPLAASLVRVEITPQYDKAESPGGGRSGIPRRPYDPADPLGAWRSREHDYDNLIKEERPAEQAGYLIAPRKVLTADIDLHPRFIKDISVRFGDRLVKAKVSSYPKDHDMMILELDGDLAGTMPMTFDASLEEPFYAVNYHLLDVAWSRHVRPFSSEGAVAVTSDGRQLQYLGGGVVVNDEGKPVAFSSGGQIPVGQNWKGSPADWPAHSISEITAFQDRVAKAADGAVLRTTLNFRSPRSDNSSGGGYYDYYGSGGSDDSMTEWNGSSVLIDPTTVVVLANIEPKVTARLERIRLFTIDGGEHTATFDGTLKDYGGFIAKLDKPLASAVRPCPTPLLQLRDKLLIKAEVAVRGETRTAYYTNHHLGVFTFGRKHAVYPNSPASSLRTWDASGDAAYFVFDPDAQLVCIPIALREKVAAQDSRYSRGNDLTLVPTSYISEAISSRPESFDSENRPLTEEEENRLAWLGVELQPMDPDLARVNNVMEETNGGRSGAIISYIYPNSPAEKAGLEMGDILLRLHVDGQPKPLDVTAQQGYGSDAFAEFFQHLDEFPIEMFDQVPSPWGNAETPLTRSLTDIGFGTPFKADVFRGGKVFSKDFTIEQGPAHYNSAKRFKSESAGMTVRDLTYEVRRFYQLTPEDPGVIVSKVESGEKAAVAGIRPFEVVTAVNDQPVRSVEEFEKVIAPGGEFRMSLKRMMTGRLVKVKLDPAGDAKPAEEGTIPSTTP